ncbi:MAG TPA: MBL fold metallo-hydrolase [Pseudonocardia sp.]|jgi:glyoxylase-like metal-dependent hydrolase (beta-lactamase superfamily II)|nr:MBL fold metallo-hydrolase [Pseudonocardia sp.]
MSRDRVQLAEALYILPAGPGRLMNSYLLDDVVLDSGLRWSGKVIARSLRGATVRSHALSHAHFDHAGSSGWLCRELAVPLFVGAADAEAMATGRVDTHGGPVANAFARMFRTEAHPVERGLKEGDVVGGFEVLEVPGHSPGALAFWRASDKVLICGDTVTNLFGTGTKPRLMMVPGLLNHDTAQGRSSLAKLTELRPSLACFGHGPPVTDPGLFASRVNRLAT